MTPFVPDEAKPVSACAGQWARRATVSLLLAEFRPNSIVELGAGIWDVRRERWLCHAASHLHRDSDRDHGPQRAMLKLFMYVHPRHARSRAGMGALATILEGSDAAVLILTGCPVPHDAGYRGNRAVRRRVPRLLSSVTDSVTAYPAIPAREESGPRIGTLYLAKGSTARAALQMAQKLALVVTDPMSSSG
jgi:hypothetical protein